ncbi:hypothetical protein [Chondromyces apiculatus]|uniref:Uncharacterized protein n=1 Tax=Chondromyces apiculatus DSM 436 TaxID=1192034 RepID=A0A017T0Y9_9BACT|nr:hypothetical protein [Chondromyces apiculatus]EYF02221.1 Hypothetical protein CAP_7293 [Chondromyces apiculatus DSM 436]
MSDKSKPVHVEEHERSKPSPVPPDGRIYPKPGPKTVHVEEHERSPPDLKPKKP